MQWLTLLLVIYISTQVVLCFNLNCRKVDICTLFDDFFRHLVQAAFVCLLSGTIQNGSFFYIVSKMWSFHLSHFCHKRALTGRTDTITFQTSIFTFFLIWKLRKIRNMYRLSCIFSDCKIEVFRLCARHFSAPLQPSEQKSNEPFIQSSSTTSSLSTCPMGFAMHRSASASAPVGCILMTTRWSPRK